MSLFSIIIPCYNAQNTLQRTIDSALNQKGDIEIILIDDCSSDDTLALMQQYANDHERIRVYQHDKNQGPAAARHTGVCHAKGDYFLFLDADDELLPRAILQLEITLTPFTDFLITGYVSSHADGVERIHPAKPLHQSAEKNFVNYLKKKISIAHGAFVVHRRVFKTTGYHEASRAGEDVPFFATLLATANCRSAPLTLARIHHREDSLRHNAQLHFDAGTQMVDDIFDMPNFPHRLKRYKPLYLAKRCLSLSRLAYQEGNGSLTRHFFHQAVLANCSTLWSLKGWKRYLKSFFIKNQCVSTSTQEPTTSESS